MVTGRLLLTKYFICFVLFSVFVDLVKRVSRYSSFLKSLLSKKSIFFIWTKQERFEIYIFLKNY